MNSSNGDDSHAGNDTRGNNNLKEYDWLAAAKTASFSSFVEDASIKSSARRSPNKPANVVRDSSASTAGSAMLSEVSCDALSLMEWATDLISVNDNNSAQDMFPENVFENAPPKSPLRHRRIPTPSRIRSKRQSTFPAEQRLPKNDLPGSLANEIPNWEGTTITADAKKSDEISCITPAALVESRNNATNAGAFGNWDEMHGSKWDKSQESTQESESDEELDIIPNKQPMRRTRNLIWAGSIAVFLIVIIAIVVPISMNSKKIAANNLEENQTDMIDGGWIEDEATTVPIESKPSQPAPSPESQPGLVEEDGWINDQATTVPVPVESNGPPLTPPKDEPNEPISSPVSTVDEPKQPVSSASAPVDEQFASDPAPAPENEPTEESEPISSVPVTAPAADNVEESKPTPATAPVPENEPVSSPVSTVEESKPAVTAPEPLNNEPESSQALTGDNSDAIAAQPVSASSQPDPSPNPLPTSIQPLSPPNPQSDVSNNSPPQPAPEVTPNPTRLPTNAPTPSCIKVSISADKFGHETSWELKDVDRNIMLGSVPVDTYDAYEKASKEFCGLQAGKYTFTISDKYGDGMTQGSPKGKFRVYLNDRQLFSGGYFTKSKSFDILIGYDPTGSMSDREYQYLVAHNNRRKAFHEKHGKDYIPLAWSHSLAERARVWATKLLAECDDPSIRHDPNRGGDGENLAKNSGSVPGVGLGQLYPVESIVTRWVEREADWDWPDNAHLTQALWRASVYLGCADVEEIRSDGSVCHVQVCRYRRAGNCDMNQFNGNWLKGVLQDESICGEQCPSEGCYVM